MNHRVKIESKYRIVNDKCNYFYVLSTRCALATLKFDSLFNFPNGHFNIQMNLLINM